jgi:hypothetical protein
MTVLGKKGRSGTSWKAYVVQMFFRASKGFLAVLWKITRQFESICALGVVLVRNRGSRRMLDLAEPLSYTAPVSPRSEPHLSSRELIIVFSIYLLELRVVRGRRRRLQRQWRRRRCIDFPESPNQLRRAERWVGASHPPEHSFNYIEKKD